MPHYRFPTFPKSETSLLPPAPSADSNGIFVFSFGNRDFVLAINDDKLISTRGGNDFITTLGDNNTVDAGAGNDKVIALGDDNVVFGGAGKDYLRGGAEDDSLWGGAGNDTIRTNGGNDYALGGKGNDFTDTGTGLGIHFGGAGNDTFSIGKEIVGNHAKDVVIALDFGNGADRLDVAPEILAKVASAVGGPVDLVPVLAAFEASGLGVAEVGQRLGLTSGGSAAFNEVATFLAQFQPNEQGQILVDATTVTTTEGDVIIALGVAPDDLLAAVA
jgi:RTX calcium-binding nonapeptide repeat (4 copies)